MNIVRHLIDIKPTLEQLGFPKKKLGMVPTMGSLHEGHLSLVRECLKENDICAVSIFVNPTQFNEEKDFESYPQDLDCDLEKLEALGVDIVFVPDTDKMYQKDSLVTIDPGPLSDKLCGMTRKGHFRGVLTVVAKLFNLLQPDNAYFGTKDYQQFVLISQMVGALNFQLALRLCPTVREEDGLAMSSRNARLDEMTRKEAAHLFQSLKLGEKLIVDTETNSLSIIERMMTDLIENTSFEIDYLSIVDPLSLEDIENVSKKTPYLIAVAGCFDSVRLIDNILHIPHG